jgi:integrase
VPKKSRFPRPEKRFVGGAWNVFWRWHYRQYTVSTGLTDRKADEVYADVVLRQFALGLAKEPPEIPADYANRPGAIRYLRDRGALANGSAGDAESWLADYAAHLEGSVSESWKKQSLNYLSRLAADAGGDFNRVTPAKAQAFVDGLARGSGRPTRNRASGVCRRFFNWSVRIGRASANPFIGIKTEREERPLEIVHCTAAERDEIIALARLAGWPDWIAVPIAFYTGCRREEIARLEWRDINLDVGRIVIRKTKTGVGRTLPIDSRLLELLQAVPPARRSGPVVPMPAGNDVGFWPKALWSANHQPRTHKRKWQ